MATPESILARVDAYLVGKAVTPTAIGKAIAGDPNFIFDLRHGREPRRKTLEKVAQRMGRLEAGETIEALLAEKAAAPTEAAA